jgi:hypothetical protein
MAQVLVTKPSSVSEADRALLHEAGIIVVETFDPSAIKLLDVSSAGIGGSGLLYAALKALQTTGTYASNAREDFAYHALAELERERAANAGPPRDSKGRFVAESRA